MLYLKRSLQKGGIVEKPKPEDNMLYVCLFLIIFNISGLILIDFNENAERKWEANRIILENYISSVTCPPGDTTYRIVTGFHGGTYLQKCSQKILN